jgi:pimeloyl-ACP methyl ester carboxylesterase
MAVLIPLVLLLVWLVPCFLFAYQMTRRAKPHHDQPVPRVDWGTFEPLRLTTADGLDVGGWFLSGQPDKPSVLLLHGNGHDRGQLLRSAEVFARDGCSVLMISFRAHGDSGGEYNDIGWSARYDVLVAVAWLEQRRPGRPIIIDGVSLGAAAATFAAADLGTRVSGYILECPYQDLKTAIRNRTELWLPPVLDRVAYGGFMAATLVILPEIDRVAPAAAVASVPESVPVLVIGGEQDNFARPHEAKAVYESVRSHGRLVMLEGVGHGPMIEGDEARFREEVLRFVAEVEAASKK